MTGILRDDELRLVVLALLGERPREFTQVRDALRERLGAGSEEGPGYEVAGSALSRLLHDLVAGGAVARTTGATALYSTTSVGDAEVARRSAEVAALLASDDSVRSRAAAARQELAAARAALRDDLTERVHRGQAAFRALDATDARHSPTASAPPNTEAQPNPSRDLVQRVDAVTQTLRLAVRAETRRAAEAGTLTPEAVARIEADVLALRARMLNELRATES
ncbi:hypothetical protein [Gulosibacter faecalis]|uniref:Transcriptional regulator, PadR family n=1 Tax=Gulosibacter faecalis TaxID=272240 RepID=A0ABW5UV76_9MICO|nr:hypothetical protein [Gulosibacter faecalis]